MHVPKFKYSFPIFYTIHNGKNCLKPFNMKLREKQNRNSCYYFVPKLLPSHLFPKTLKFKINETIFPLFLYGFETESLALRKEP